MTSNPSNNHSAEQTQTPGQQQLPTRRRIGLMIVLVVVIASLLDWTRSPRQQISVPLYEALVIRSYRTGIRPLTSHFVRCRFKPNCSQCSSEAVHKYGVPKGLWLT